MARITKHHIQSLDRGLQLLLAFTPVTPRLTLTQLAQVTGMNKPAVQRMTDTLLSLNFLGRNRHKEFYLGPTLLSLGYTCLQGFELRQVAREQLRAFSDRIGCTVNLTALNGTELVVLYRREVGTFYTFDVHAGSRLPAHCTSMGKVLLAALPDDELGRRLADMQLTPYTPHSPATVDQLREELMATRERGYGISDRESSLVLYAVAAPIIDGRARVVAAINVSMYVDLVPPERREELTQHLLAQGRRLSTVLGYAGPYPALPLGLADEVD
jgi:IclR family transcriptional regulator, pca regulon regulatory protein